MEMLRKPTTAISTPTIKYFNSGNYFHNSVFALTFLAVYKYRKHENLLSPGVPVFRRCLTFLYASLGGLFRIMGD